MEEADLVQRSVNVLRESPAKQEKLAAIALLKGVIAARRARSRVVLDAVSALLERLGDPAESVRLEAAAALRETCAELLGVEEALPRIISHLHTTLAPAAVAERSEVVRLAELKLLLRVVHVSAADSPVDTRYGLRPESHLDLFIDDIVQILQRQLSDDAPDNRIVVNKTVYKLAVVFRRATHILTKDAIRALTQALVDTLGHNTFLVRKSAVLALEQLHLSPASEDISKMLAPRVPALVSDANYHVRLALCTACATWLNEHVDRHVYTSFFTGIILAFLSDNEISANAFALLRECGDVYEREHMDELRLAKEARIAPTIEPFATFVEHFAPDNYWANVFQHFPGGRLGLGCRTLVEKTSVGIMKAVLGDVTGWSEESRVKACAMLSAILLVCENYVLRFSDEILAQVLPFLLTCSDGSGAAALRRVIGILFSVLRTGDIVRFLRVYFKTHDLTTRQTCMLLSLLSVLFDTRRRHHDLSLRFASDSFNLTVAGLGEILDVVYLSDGILYSGDASVRAAYRQSVHSVVEYIRASGILDHAENVAASSAPPALARHDAPVAQGDARGLAACESSESAISPTAPEVVEFDLGSFVRTKFAAGLTVALLAILDVEKDAPRGPSQGSGAQTSQAQLQAQLEWFIHHTFTTLPSQESLSDADVSKMVHEYIATVVKLLSIDVTSSDLESRIGVFVSFLSALFSSSLAFPRSCEGIISSLVTKLFRLTEVDRYSPRVRTVAARSVYVIIRTMVRVYDLSNPNLIYYFNNILKITTWKFGIRTPLCLDYALKALTVMLGSIPRGAEESPSKIQHIRECLLKANPELFESLVGRVVGNLDNDDAIVRLSTLELCSSMLGIVPIGLVRDVLYPLVCRLDDSHQEVCIAALTLAGSVVQCMHNTDDCAASYIVDGKVKLSNGEVLRLVTLHLDDPVSEIANACEELFGVLNIHCCAQTRAEMHAQCCEMLSRCTNKALYERCRDLVKDAPSMVGVEDEKVN